MEEGKRSLPVTRLTVLEGAHHGVMGVVVAERTDEEVIEESRKIEESHWERI